MIYRVAPEQGSTAIYDYPGAYAQRFDGVDKGSSDTTHRHPGVAVYVGTAHNGIYIHGSPVCSNKTCIVVLQQWTDLQRAIAGEKRLSFSISV